MAIGYKDVQGERQWKASTGMSKKEFDSLCVSFGQAYESIYGKSLQDRQKDSSVTSVLNTYEELLFFTLYSMKIGLTYDLLGLSFGLPHFQPSNPILPQSFQRLPTGRPLHRR